MDDDSLPNVTVGMEALRRDHPWPELPLDVEPFYLSLDGGGRELVIDLIRQRDISLMVEVGCFLCGSSRQWLEGSPTLEIIGVDPWNGNWAPYVRNGIARDDRSLDTLDEPDQIADTIQRHGNYRIALNNVRDERDRFIPVRQWSPQALHYLKEREIRPELIYIDALKTEDDLWVAHELFPRAILCGDDWNWTDEDGRYRMREHVEAFAAAKSFDIQSERATWLLNPHHPREDGLRPLRVGSQAWDAEATERLVAQVDPVALALLRLVASAARRGDEVTLDAAARALGRTVTELMVATREVNDATASAGRVQVLALGGSGGGWSTIEHRPFVIAAGLPSLLEPF